MQQAGDTKKNKQAKGGSKMKVTLVNANLIQTPAVAPVALDVLNSSLRFHGHEVDLLDLTPVAGTYQEAIRDYFSSHHPDFVGITFRNACDLYFNSIGAVPDDGSFVPSHVKVSKEILKYFSRDKIVAGGIGFSSLPQRILEKTGLRFGVVGAGERIFPEIIEALQVGKIPRHLKGFIEIGHLYVPSENNYVPIDVDRKSFVNNKWYYQQGGLIGLRTSNGCKMKCVYCIEPRCKGEMFLRSPELVVAELDQLVEEGIMDIHFTDAECNLPFEHSKSVKRAIIGRGYPKELKIWDYSQVLPFDQEYIALSKDAGVAGILFSTDHIDSGMLKSFGKWYQKKDIIQTTKLCNDHGILVMHELVFGMPGETWDKMKRAIDFMRELDPYVTGITVGIGIMPGCRFAEDENILRLSKLPPKEREKNGLYCNGEVFCDPTYYVDPALKVPEIFQMIRDYIGDDIYRIMAPTVKSTTTTDNNLVNTDRIVRQKKGAYWAYYRDLFKK